METTMAATPKARMATALPVPPPPLSSTAMMPALAFPPQEIRPTRRTTVRVSRPRGGGLVSDALATLADFIESAPVPMLPESAWVAIGRAWFFIAGTTAGILLALALIAIGGSKHSPAREGHREGHVVTASGTARVLVVQRAPTTGERGIGQLAENDLDEVAQAAPPPVVRRAPVVARRPSSSARRAPVGKDLLTAGL